VSYNGSGTFLINSAGQPVVPGTTITTTAFNALTADLASGLTTAMTKDGQTVPTANIPMGGFKLTGLGAGTSATDAAQFGQLQNAPVATLITVAGADTITGTLVQTLTAYATGQQFSFVAAGTNTTAVTLNIDGLGAKAVTRTGAVALAAGALVSGQMAIVEYDGTRFQLINANAFTNLTVSGALTVGTTLAVTGVATLTAQPILSSLTASLPVFSDASKGLVSNAMTGTGSVMMSASPTTTGTLTAAAINASGTVAMAGAATVGTTLGVTGTSTMGVINAGGKFTTSFAGGGDFVAVFTNTTAATPYTVRIIEPAAAVSGYPLLQVVNSAGSTDRFKVMSGTGDTTIGGTLGVTGVVTFSNYGAGAATFSAAGVISSVSDERLKIKDGVIADPIPMMMALEPGYYFGKPEANMGDGRQLGFYAQNVRSAIGPEAAPDPEDQVSLDADGNEVSRKTRPWGYYDRSVLAVAIEALKVHEGRLAALQADFQSYKSSHP